jgi:transcriptional/translational regulatory protein YebC/TACO1
MAALDAGASDVQREGEVFIVTTDLPSFNSVQQGLRTNGIQFDEAELAMVPKATVDSAGPDAHKLLKLLDMLDELDDVQKVYSNANIDEAVYAEVEG